MTKSERALKLFFGKKAEHIESQLHDPDLRGKWLSKTFLKLMADVNGLDTAIQHKAKLMDSLNSLMEGLSRSREPTGQMFFDLLTFVGRLLGYDHCGGRRYYSLIYYRTPTQYYDAHSLGGGDALQCRYDEKNVVLIRRELIRKLSVEGYDTFKIALIFSMSERSVKILLKDLS